MTQGSHTSDTTPSTRHAAALARRVLGARVEGFFFELISPDAGRDVFELADAPDGIVIRGNTAGAMATGLNWYLRHQANCQVTWCGVQLDLPHPLPRLGAPIRQTAWAKHRYFLNYCCFCYSLAWYDWPQWETLIDWMALNGINMPLAITGQEATWQATGKRLGLSDADMDAFFSGPPFLPFVWMGCFDGWAGPLPKGDGGGWIESHEALGQKILARQRELGMTPVLQGFTGHVPPALLKKFPDAKFTRTEYLGWETFMLDPHDPRFERVAAVFMEEQTRRFGTNHYYASDPFIEMTPPSGDTEYLASLARALHRGMAASDPQAVWVLQSWPFTFFLTDKFWTPPRLKAFFDAVPDEHMLVLDLFCESNPGWSKTDAFSGKPWLWCNVQNFGGNITLTGGMETNNTGLAAARRDPGGGGHNLRGVGMVNEGLCANPIVYEFLFEQAWRDAPVDLAAWMRDFATWRYGQANAEAHAAWDVLRRTAYNGFHFFEERIGGHKSLLALRPTAQPPKDGFYDNAVLAEAWRLLLAAADALGASDTFRFDLVHVARHVLSNYAGDLRRDLSAAIAARDAAKLRAVGDEILEILADLDMLVGTRPEFLLGRWIADARRWGQSGADKNRCEWAARLVLTHFGLPEQSGLHDYARREWQGMLADYYAPRWKAFIDAQEAALARGVPLDEKAFHAELARWERAWIDTPHDDPTAPRGDSLETARRLWAKYRQRVTGRHTAG